MELMSMTQIRPMSTQVSITLDSEVLQFIDSQTQNRSDFINELLRREQRRQFQHDLANAYIEQADDPDLQAELELWDVVVGDGLAPDA